MNANKALIIAAAILILWVGAFLAGCTEAPAPLTCADRGLVERYLYDVEINGKSVPVYECATPESLGAS